MTTPKLRSSSHILMAEQVQSWGGGGRQRGRRNGRGRSMEGGWKVEVGTDGEGGQKRGKTEEGG